MYKCHFCGKQFIVGKRLISEKIWQEYLKGKQTYQQLSEKYNCSKRTIQRKIDLHNLTISVKQARKVIILMDTTY